MYFQLILKKNILSILTAADLKVDFFFFLFIMVIIDPHTQSLIPSTGNSAPIRATKI